MYFICRYAIVTREGGLSMIKNNDLKIEIPFSSSAETFSEDLNYTISKVANLGGELLIGFGYAGSITYRNGSKGYWQQEKERIFKKHKKKKNYIDFIRFLQACIKYIVTKQNESTAI